MGSLYKDALNNKPVYCRLLAGAIRKGKHSFEDGIRKRGRSGDGTATATKS